MNKAKLKTSVLQNKKEFKLIFNDFMAPRFAVIETKGMIRGHSTDIDKNIYVETSMS